MSEELATTTESTALSTETAPANVLVIGAGTGAGYILSGLLTNRGHRVVGMNRLGTIGAKRLRKVNALPVSSDFTRAGELVSMIKMAKADVVVNLGTMGVNGSPQIKTNDADHYERTLAITQAGIEACQSAGVQRYIHGSFSFLYGDHEGEWVDEDTKLDHYNSRFEPAIAAEELVTNSGLDVTIVRAGFVYGGYVPASEQLRSDIVKGRSVQAGTGIAGWIHENDLARAILTLCTIEDTSTIADVLNIVDDTPATPDEFVEELALQLGVGEPKFTDGPPAYLRSWLHGHPNEQILADSAKISNVRAKEQLGWEPGFPRYSDGIDQMLMVWRAEMADSA